MLSPKYYFRVPFPKTHDVVNHKWKMKKVTELNCFYEIQTHKRFKGTLFIWTKHNIGIFGLIPIIKLQNDT